MIPRSRIRALLLAAAISACSMPASAAEGRAGIVHGENLALARQAAARSISRRFDRVVWPGFDAGEAPAVIFQPGGWAVAAGFPEPPEGFELIPGIQDGDRPVYRVTEPGGFTDPGRSPARVAGRWAVISRIDPPPVIPPPGRLGRPVAEEAIARFIGDAFMIHLAQARGLESPFPSGIPVYPDSAELTALTAVEQRLLLETARVVNLDETNIEEFKEMARQIVAVRRERWRIMGPETAGLEHAVESTYGMGDLIEQSVNRMAMLGGFVPRQIFESDPTYLGHGNSLLLRLIRTNYAMGFTPDSPAATVDQITARARNLGFLLIKIDDLLGWKGLKGGWKDPVVEGKTPLVDLLAGGDESKETDAGDLLERAKEEQGYVSFLRLAREDLGRMVRDREAAIGALFPAGDSLEIRLGSVPASLANDMAATIHLGKGRSLHSGKLDIRAGGFHLALDEYPPSPGPRVMTTLNLDRSLAGITLRLEGLEVRLAGEPIGTLPRPLDLGPDRALTAAAPGLRIEAGSGSLSRRDDGALLLVIDSGPGAGPGH